MMQHFKNWLLSYALMFISLISLLFVYWYFIDEMRPVLEVHNLPVPIEKPVYTIGETPRAFMDFCKKRDISGEISDYLIDSFYLPFTPEPTNLPPGCHKVWVELKKIPEFVPLGIYHFERNVRYRLNPVKYVQYKVITQDFEVR